VVAVRGVWIYNSFFVCFAVFIASLVLRGHRTISDVLFGFALVGAGSWALVVT